MHDGELGLLDNIGSAAGTRQWTLGVRKFSKSGTPKDVFAYHGLNAEGIVETCGRALAETALERVKLSRAALSRVQGQQGQQPATWRELWPDPV